MSGIQLLLLTGVVFIGLYFITRLKKRLLDIFLLFILIAAAIIFILWPDITNTIARKLNVGRGADLIFYISILIFWFVILKLYARMRRMEQALTDMARKQALDTVEESDNRQ